MTDVRKFSFSFVFRVYCKKTFLISQILAMMR